MTSPPSLFHALLRPSILQILRTTGYHSTRPAVLDSVTDLAARYLSLLCEAAARHAAHNHGDSADFDVVDVRLALQDAGALLPDRSPAEQMWRGEEDVRGVEEFVAWFAGQRMRELMEAGKGDGEADATDYLNALKKKHNKTGEDTKYAGTILGRPNEVGEIQVEGGPERSIGEWISNRSGEPARSVTPQTNGDHDALSPTASSGLSSVGDRLGDDGDMDLS